MMSPSDTRKYIDQSGVDYGQNVPLPDDVDTSECTEFFGTRCPNNVHVKGSRLAHVDRVDPRENPFGHLKYDVGVPYAAMLAPIGATFGALLSEDPKKGAEIGGILGGSIGLLVDLYLEFKTTK